MFIAEYVIGSEMYAIREKFMFNSLENRKIYGKIVLGIKHASFFSTNFVRNMFRSNK